MERDPGEQRPCVLSEDALYAAVVSRDRRFEGRFVMAVTSTGIYCRPGCPARTPLRRNVRFYRHPAEAQAASFRACARCRPDAAVWVGTSSTVKRALTLIENGDGAGDGGAVRPFVAAAPALPALAARLGVGERHLRRLFQEHLGASPVQVAQTRRAWFARRLLDDTDLPLAELALAAGFASVRRFNAVMLRAFGKTPSALRSGAREHSAASARHQIASTDHIKNLGATNDTGDTGDTGATDDTDDTGSTGRTRRRNALVLRLPFKAPFAWAPLIAFHAARAIPGVEEVSDGVYRRTIRGDEEDSLLEVRPAAAHLIVTLHAPSLSGLREIVSRVRRVFDLGADPLAIADFLARDARLAPSVAACPGLRVPGAWDGFELGVRAILGQQVTVARATVLSGKLVTFFGRPLASPDGRLTHTFPLPARFAASSGDEIAHLLGMPRARGRSIFALAETIAAGQLPLDGSLDPGELSRRLIALPGIGPWTAAYLAMRLGDPDALPAGDLWLRRTFTRLSSRLSSPAAAPLSSVNPGPPGPPGPLDERALVVAAEAWRPFRSYAAMHLWNSELLP